MAVCAVMLIVSIMTIGTPDAGFELPDKLTVNEVHAHIRALIGADEQGRAKKDLAICEKYCRAAYAAAVRNSVSGCSEDAYVRIFTENYLRISEAIGIVRAALPELCRLPDRKEGGLLAFADTMARGCGIVCDRAAVASCAAVFGARRKLTWREILALRPAVTLALLKQVTVYASKILYRDRMKRLALHDARKGKPNANYSMNASYVKVFADACDSLTVSEICRICERDVYAAAAEDGDVLAGYSAGLSVTFDCMRKNIFSDTFLVSLSSAADVFYTRPCGFSESSMSTRKAILGLNSKAAEKRGMSEEASAEELCRRAECEHKDITEYLIPRKVKFMLPIRLCIVAGMAAAAAAGTAAIYMSPAGIAGALLALPALLYAADVLFLRAVGKYVHSRPVPELSIAAVRNRSAAIVICAAIGKKADIDSAYSALLTIAAANPNEIFSYGLLFDCINDGYPPGNAAEDLKSMNVDKRTFILLRRSAKDRKRGALAALNSLMLTGDKSEFAAVVGNVGHAEYVITLDTDTLLNDAERLVAAMSHPYNARFGVMTLDMHSRLGGLTTPFARIMCGGVGFSGYDGVTSDAVTKLHGYAGYCGKGIYRVREFSEATAKAFPEGRVLSHDFLEGALSVCGDSGITALEEFPHTSAAYYIRAERWMRGDLQNLPYLRRSAPDAHGKKRGRRIGAAAWAAAIVNTVKIIYPPLSMAAVIVSAFFGYPVVMLAAVMPFAADAAFALGTLFVRPNETVRGILRAYISLMYLPHAALTCIISVLTAVICMFAGKNLQKWSVYSPRSDKKPLLVACFAAGLICLAAFLLDRHAPTIFASAIFLTALPVDRALGREDKRKKPAQHERELWMDAARRTWKYFACAMSVSDLPPDNHSEENGWAMRTSPTDIGMAMSAAVCACDIGVISRQECDNTVSALLTGLEKLEKYRGCPYNWYSCGGKILQPAYVSSVDCGNLLAALVHVMSLGGENARRAATLAAAMDMSFLSDGALLHIGYNRASGTLDEGKYDLLASESALTYLMMYASGMADKRGYVGLSRMCLGKRMHAALASWTGGAFEYMLPLLYFKAPKLSLLFKSAVGAVCAHKKYALRAVSPIWGASESLYGDKYANGDHKYKAFGAPEVSLASYGGRDVFAPYAAVMCAGVVDEANVGVVQMLAPYLGEAGYYDSLDMFAGAVQRSCMTHHQGMIMLAICNLLEPEKTYERMMRHPGVRAASLLLEESADPLFSAITKPHVRAATANLETERRAYIRSKMPDINLLTNGEYNMIIDGCGRNAQIYHGKYLSRFDRLYGLTLHVAMPGGKYELTVDAECFHKAGCTRFLRKIHGTDWEVSATVFDGKNAEMRRITCINNTDKPTTMSVIARFTPCIAGRYADLSHKTFSRMFLRTSFRERLNYVYAARRGEPDHVALFSSLPADYCGDGRCVRDGSAPPFGMTTEAELYAETKVTLNPHGKSTFFFVLGAGSIDELDEIGRMCLDSGYLEYCFYAGCAASAARAIPEVYREAASELIFGGEANGAPRALTAVASETTAAGVISAVRYLKEISAFGGKCSLTVLSRMQSLYTSRGMALLLDEAERAGGMCRICDISSGMNDEAFSALKSGTDIRALRNKPLSPFPETCLEPADYYALPRPELETELGIGGFTPDGGYYIDAQTPSPWYNILSDGKIGCLTSDHGEYTFASNSREEKLTWHSCDELCDTPGDGVFVSEGNRIIGLSRTSGNGGCAYSAFHSFGYSEYRCGFDEMVITRTVYVSDGVKYSALRFENKSRRVRMLYAMYFAELVLGDIRQRTSGGIKFGKGDGCIYAANGDLSVYLSSDVTPDSTAFYAESYRDSAGRVRGCGRLVSEGITPALAASCRVTVPPHGSARITFALSVTPVRVTETSADAALLKQKLKFEKLPAVISDELPFKYYLKWLYVQTLVARFTAKCGFQQPGGATGFRDSLQDASALLGTHASEIGKFIVDCAAHQFEAGDVMHWWHEPSIGVRTRICDDKLFLPVAVADYIEYTGDERILECGAPYLENTPIPDGMNSVYGYMRRTAAQENIRGHVMRAFSSVALSPRGLVLMGSGDWNDGMDGVGAGGKGESVWCSMFAYYAAGRFLKYAGEEDRGKLAELRRVLRKGIASCRLRDRYIRAFDDNGRPMGTEDCPECKIDLLVAAWSVLSGIEHGSGARKILLTAYNRLYDPEHKLLKLLDPPITDRSVGYIADYPPGVRENGGQYTHAAVWFLRALYEADMDELAESLMLDLLPVSHTGSIAAVNEYLKEPYVLAGDVYSGVLAGRGGWTWYTGSAGLMYRTIVEYRYGIVAYGNRITIRPHMVQGHARVIFRHRQASFLLDLSACGTGNTVISIDGTQYASDTFALSSLDGKTVTVRRSAAETGSAENR